MTITIFLSLTKDDFRRIICFSMHFIVFHRKEFLYCNALHSYTNCCTFIRPFFSGINRLVRSLRIVAFCIAIFFTRFSLRVAGAGAKGKPPHFSVHQPRLHFAWTESQTVPTKILDIINPSCPCSFNLLHSDMLISDNPFWKV